MELLHKKHHKREKKLEYKALKAAKLERTVENELKERLRNGVYSDIYNFDKKIFTSLTEKEKTTEETELESGKLSLQSASNLNTLIKFNIMAQHRF